jgi:hypothetical protein
MKKLRLSREKAKGKRQNSRVFVPGRRAFSRMPSAFSLVSDREYEHVPGNTNEYPKRADGR